MEAEAPQSGSCAADGRVQAERIKKTPQAGTSQLTLRPRIRELEADTVRCSGWKDRKRDQAGREAEAGCVWRYEGAVGQSSSDEVWRQEGEGNKRVARGPNQRLNVEGSEQNGRE